MPIESKEIFKALGMTEVEKPEDLVPAIEAAGWLKESQIFKDEAINKRVFGRGLASRTTKVVQYLRSKGVELTQEDVDGVDLEKVIELGITRMDELNGSKLKEAQDANKLNIDERVKAAEEAQKKALEKVKEYEGVVKSKASEFENILSEKNKEISGIRLATVKEAASSRLKYLPDLDPLKKIGFLSEMEKNYKVDFEEDGKTPFVVSTKDGQRIKSTQHAGTFLSLDEIYEMEGTKASVISVAQNGGKPAVKTAAPVIQTNQNQQNNSANFGRTVAPGARVQ